MSSVFDLLDREWCQIRTDRSAARRLAAVCRLAGDSRTLADLEAFVRAADPATADRILLALVTQVVHRDDSLAARVLLQLLLPGTRNLARRWWALGDHDERAAAAVAAVYGRIRSYPLVRRPGRVAANVLMDAAVELRRSVPRLPTVVSVVVQDEAPPPEPVPHPAAELAEVLSDAVGDGVIELADAQLIAQSRIAGRRVADIATTHRLGTRALWDRRQRAEARLAAVAVAVAGEGG